MFVQNTTHPSKCANEGSKSYSVAKKVFKCLPNLTFKEHVIIIIIIKLIHDKDPMEQSDTRHSIIADFNSDPFEVQIKYLYGILLPKYTFYTQIFDFNNNTI